MYIYVEISPNMSTYYLSKLLTTPLLLHPFLHIYICIYLYMYIYVEVLVNLSTLPSSFLDYHFGLVDNQEDCLCPGIAPPSGDVVVP